MGVYCSKFVLQKLTNQVPGSYMHSGSRYLHGLWRHEDELLNGDLANDARQVANRLHHRLHTWDSMPNIYAMVNTKQSG